MASTVAFTVLCLIALLGLANAAACIIQGQTTFNVTNNGATSYQSGSCSNPTFRIVEGVTYSWNINATGHPFWIKTARGTGTTNGVTGVVSNGVAVGTVTFTPAVGTGGTNIFYNCQIHNGMGGTINILVAPPPSPAVSPSVTSTVASAVAPDVASAVAPAVVPDVASAVAPSVAPSVVPAVAPSVAPAPKVVPAPRVAPVFTPASPDQGSIVSVSLALTATALLFANLHSI